MKHQTIKSLLAAAVGFFGLAGFNSCTEHVDTSDRYVFNEITISMYLEDHEQFSEYCQLLKEIKPSAITETSVMQLLSARGHYTCFAPTNDALHQYLEKLCAKGVCNSPSWDGFVDEFKLDSIKKVIVLNSIINSGDEDEAYTTYMLPDIQDAEIQRPNMYDRKLIVHRINGTDSILINDCHIDPRNRDIPALNGYIHVMSEVVAPSNNTVGNWMSDIVRDKKEGFYVSSMLAMAIGYADTLNAVRDEVYEVKHQAGLIPEQVGIKSGNLDNIYMGYTPEHRYYGFTYFAETDSVWSALIGKPALDITVKDVYKYLVDNNIYPEAKRDTIYNDKDNLLNRFVTYHFLPERLGPDRLVIHWSIFGYDPVNHRLGAAIWHNYTTMGHRRLLKVYESPQSNGVCLNRFPVLDNGMSGNHEELSCDPKFQGIQVGKPNLEGENNLRNGIIYPIEKLLVYDDDTREAMSKSRMRFDANDMWPESMNNDIRSNELTDIQHRNIGIPNDGFYPYYDDLRLSKDTYFAYWSCRNDGNKNNWTNYLGDECNLTGAVDVTMRLPPVPRNGIYEVRYCSQNGGAQGNRGIYQFYFGTQPENLAALDIPINCGIGGTYINTPNGNIPSGIGWVSDGDLNNDEDAINENDKQMRLKGFMKGAKIYYSAPSSRTGSGRESPINSRRILLRKQMNADETYYLRFRSCLDDPMREMYLDYIELVSKEVFDNPETREDIW